MAPKRRPPLTREDTVHWDKRECFHETIEVAQRLAVDGFRYGLTAAYVESLLDKILTQFGHPGGIYRVTNSELVCVFKQNEKQVPQLRSFDHGDWDRLVPFLVQETRNTARIYEIQEGIHLQKLHELYKVYRVLKRKQDAHEIEGDSFTLSNRTMDEGLLTGELEALSAKLTTKKLIVQEIDRIAAMPDVSPKSVGGWLRHITVCSTATVVFRSSSGLECLLAGIFSTIVYTWQIALPDGSLVKVKVDPPVDAQQSVASLPELPSTATDMLDRTAQSKRVNYQPAVPFLGAFSTAVVTAIVKQTLVVDLDDVVVVLATVYTFLPGYKFLLALSDIVSNRITAGFGRIVQSAIALIAMGGGYVLGTRTGQGIGDIVNAMIIESLPRDSFRWNPIPDGVQWFLIVVHVTGLCFMKGTSSGRLSSFLIDTVMATVFSFSAYALAYAVNQASAQPVTRGVTFFVSTGMSLLVRAFASVVDRPVTLYLMPATQLLLGASLGFRGLITWWSQNDWENGGAQLVEMVVVSLLVYAGMLVAQVITRTTSQAYRDFERAHKPPRVAVTMGDS